MKAPPEIRYARADNVSIAYSRWGQGDHLIIYTPPLVSNIELMWELPEWERMLTWAGRHHQIMMIDKRGVGLSDRVFEPSTLEENVADVVAIMDAEGVESAHFVGHSEGGAIAVAMAAGHPGRVQRLCLIGVPAMGVSHATVSKFADAEQPLPNPEETREKWLGLVRTWGRPESEWLGIFAPSVAEDPRVRRWWDRFERQSCSSGSLLAMFRGMSKFDLPPMLGKIDVPTLVCHAVGDRVNHVAEGRVLASLIPGAKLIEWDSIDHQWPFAPNWRKFHNDQIEFLTRNRPGLGALRQIASVLFTDIVDSTKRASEQGDADWRQVMELHDSICGLRVSAYDGTIVHGTGDGTLAIFPDPVSAVTAALELTRDLAAQGIQIRAGIHIGQIEIRDDGDISGIAVNIAARVQALADGGEVLVSQTVRDMLMGSTVTMRDRGEHPLKGVEGAWHVYAASG